jgi:hypothetical protein
MALVAKRITPPIKGWNTLTAVRSMSHDYAVQLENVWLDQSSAMNRRPGQITYLTALPSQAKHMFEFVSDSGSQTQFIQSVNGSVYNYTTGWVAALTAAFPGGTCDSARIDTSATNVTVIGNGVDNAMYFDGTSWLNVVDGAAANVVLGTILHTHKGRMYTAGIATNKMSIRYSNLSANSGGKVWDAGGAAQFSVADAIPEGDTITGMCTYRDNLVVTCANHIIVYEGDDPAVAAGGTLTDYQPWRIAKVIRGVGCIDNNSIQNIGNDVLFLSRNGFKSLEQIMVQGDAAVADASVPINNHIAAITRANLNTTLLDISSTFSQLLGLYICNVGGITYVYHTMFSSWAKWTGIENLLFTSISGSTYTVGTHQHLLNSDVPYDVIDGSATNTTIGMVWELPPVRSGDNENKSRWNKVEVIYEAADESTLAVSTWLNLDQSDNPLDSLVTLNPRTSQSTSTTMRWGGPGFTGANYLWGNPTGGSTWLGASVSSGSAKIPVNGRSELFSVRFMNNSQVKFKIVAIEIYYNEGGNR